tara:strand:+ start:82 stop:561 length:480 start_codon:yes stop_codon:yes gene_type:complete
MADLMNQTNEILNKKKVMDTKNTEGNLVKEEVKEPPSLEDQTKTAIEQGIYSPDLRNKFIAEITGNMFGDPTGGLKYPNGTDKDKAFESNRLKGLSLEELFDEYQYWNSEAQRVFDLGEGETLVKDWLSKMYEKLGLKKEPKGKETELLKGSNYYPPQE